MKISNDYEAYLEEKENVAECKQRIGKILQKKESAKKEKKSSVKNQSDYIFPDSDTQKLKKSQVLSFDFNSSALATIALTCDSNDINELKEISNTLSNKFSLIEGVGNVQIKGLPTEKVSVKPILGLESTTLLIVEALSKSSFTTT